MDGSNKTISAEEMNKILQDDDWADKVIKARGAKNTDIPRPPAPYLKEISSGMIHVWNAAMAKRPDLVVCCDKDGNEDPAKWEGARPAGMRSDGSMPKLDEIPLSAAVRLIKKQTPLTVVQPQINFDRALAEYGLSGAKTYSEPTEINSAMPFAGMGNLTIEEKVKEIQRVTGLTED